jgi:HEPN domain-containing protein
MSYSKNRHQAQRWLQTAEEDVHAAQVLLTGGMYAQACFYAQQSAEKAIKALWYLLDADPWGHSVQRLIAEFPQRTELPDLEVWLDQGALLDKFYALLTVLKKMDIRSAHEESRFRAACL